MDALDNELLLVTFFYRCILSFMLNALSSRLSTASLTDTTQSLNYNIIEMTTIIQKVYFRQKLNNFITHVGLQWCFLASQGALVMLGIDLVVYASGAAL